MKIRNIIFIILAALILLLPLVKIDRVGGRTSETEQRTLASRPTAKKLSEDYKTELKDYLNDNIGFREEFMKLRTMTMLNAFNLMPSNMVRKGTNGYYFYTMDFNLDIVRGKYPLNENGIASIAESMDAINEKFEEKGIDFQVFLPPSKASIYPEYTGLGVDSLDITPSEKLANAINEKTEVPALALRQTMMAAKEQGDYYYKTDSHWNHEGAYIAYCACIDQLNSTGYSLKKAEVTYVEDEYSSDLSKLIGVRGSLGMEKYMRSVITDQKATEDETSDRYNQLKGILQGDGFNGIFMHFVNESSDGPKVVMFGDSLYGYWNMPYLFAESFSEFTYIWNYDILENVIDYLQPDLVIYEMGERYTYVLPGKNSSFTFRYLSDYQAQITDIKEDDENVYVTVKNTSSDCWESKNYVKLAVFIDDHDTTLRGYLQTGTTVEAGESYTFEITKEGINALEGDKDTVAFVMVQEGITYFGEKKNLK